jgi:hypothetical protein
MSESETQRLEHELARVIRENQELRAEIVRLKEPGVSARLLAERSVKTES